MGVEQRNKGHEQDLHLPLNFIVIGSGQVVDKYWFRSKAMGQIGISSIVSLENEVAFRGRYPEYDGQYRQSSSAGETLELVSRLSREIPNPNIAVVTSADVRLELVRGILEHANGSRVFIEKPYGTTHEEIDQMRQLLLRYSNRIHLSGKYATGRADILFPHLPEGKTPERISARIIEGTDYFNIVKEKVRSQGWHQYLIDGPELDIGFHMLDITGVASNKFGGIKDSKIATAFDLSQARPDFVPGYGIGATVLITNSEGKVIRMDIQAGKADAPNERFIDFDYGDFRIVQEYTVGEALDPVYSVSNGNKQTLAQHPSGYNYYATELSPQSFCNQTLSQQLQSLHMTDLCLDLRDQRLSSQIPPQ